MRFSNTAALVLSVSVLLPAASPTLALAQDEDETTAKAPSRPERVLARKNPLDGEPPVRHRKLLVKRRFEAALAFESSVNADYMHTPSFGVKLEYHLSDMLSIGGVGFFGTPFKTGLASRISDSLDASVADPMDPTPSRAEFDEHLNKMPIHAAAYATLTPWYGKLAAFSRFYLHFDFYFSGGLAIAQLKTECCSFNTDSDPENSQDGDPNNDPPKNDGTRLGIYLGGGIHVFMSDFIALDLSVRDYLFSDNPSGLDFTGDEVVKKDDNRFLNHLFLGLGVSFFFPSKVKRTP